MEASTFELAATAVSTGEFSTTSSAGPLLIRIRTEPEWPCGMRCLPEKPSATAEKLSPTTEKANGASRPSHTGSLNSSLRSSRPAFVLVPVIISTSAWEWSTAGWRPYLGNQLCTAWTDFACSSATVARSGDSAISELNTGGGPTPGWPWQTGPWSPASSAWLSALSMWVCRRRPMKALPSQLKWWWSCRMAVVLAPMLRGTTTVVMSCPASTYRCTSRRPASQADALGKVSGVVQSESHR
mmetsp:Transcript_36648/g.92630  ORF Transcript_36648/g.92630 Transcript_36648/m.92630 type:complete len:241 (-) Transcript_36648:705-1427(-)